MKYCKKCLFLILFLSIIISSYSTNGLEENEFYKKAIELLDHAKEEYDKGDYDKGFEYSEEAREYLVKANEYNMIQIYIIRINTKKELADKWINKAEEMGAKDLEDTQDVYQKTKDLYSRGEEYFAEGEQKEEFSEKANLYQDSIDSFNDAAETAKSIVASLSVDKDSAWSKLQEAQSKREKLLKDGVLKNGDENDDTILGLLEEGEEAFTEKNYYVTKNKSEEAMEIMDQLILDDQAKKLLTQAKDAVEDAKNRGGETEYPNEMEDANTVLGDAETLYNDKIYEESMEKSKYVIDLINGLELVPVFPKYYRIRYIRNNRDCLWKISGFNFVYNNPWQWKVLYIANKKRLIFPDNPDLIHPWRVIVIPSLRGEKREGYYDPKKKYPKFNPRINYGELEDNK